MSDPDAARWRNTTATTTRRAGPTFAPPEPPNGPPSSHAFGWHLWTLQNAAILVFMALALAAIVIALFVVATPTDDLPAIIHCWPCTSSTRC